MISLKIALRFLRSSRSQTILVILGIAVGVAVQVFVGSLIGSLQTSLVDATVGRSSQVTVVPADGSPTIHGWDAMVMRIRGVGAVTAVSVAADSAAFIDKSGRTASVVVRGFSFEDANGIYRLDDALYEGSLPQTSIGVLVGKELKNDLNLHLAETFDVVTANASRYAVTIAGFYDLKVASINRAWILASLSTSQTIFGFGNNITSIEMQVKEVFKADKVAADVEAAISDSSVKVLDWKTQNQQLLSGLQGQSISSYMIQLFVLVSVVIAIASVLAIKVVQKSRQLGILKAMGITDRTASMVFLFEGLFLGIGGAIGGVLFGLFLLYGFSIGTANADGSSLIAIRIDYVFIAISGIIAILAAIFAAVLPARRSSRLSPIEVIRSG